MVITILDEVLFAKKINALKRYFMKNYKYLAFEVIPKLKREGKIDGSYKLELPTDALFEKVYGKMQLNFTVKNDVAILEDIIPGEILTACYEKDLPTYKGIPYDTERDLAKIKIMEKLLWQTLIIKKDMENVF